jgi:protein N-terminal amidase
VVVDCLDITDHLDKMRIGCLQFAPQVGDIDNNLNRADAVLAKANPEDLDTLDVLVLPELAFTGMG